MLLLILPLQVTEILDLLQSAVTNLSLMLVGLFVTKVIVSPYSVFSRPHLECCIHIAAPHFKKIIGKPEQDE